MKKLLIISGILLLAACQAPTYSIINLQTGPRQCKEYNNEFVCSTMTSQGLQVEKYPKNNQQMNYDWHMNMYGNPSLSQTVYGRSQ